MKNKFFIIFGILTLLLISSISYSDTIVLKNGKIIHGRIIKRSPVFIRIEKDGGPLWTEYLHHNIKEIFEGNIYLEQQQIIEQKKTQKEKIIQQKQIEKKILENSINQKVITEKRTKQIPSILKTEPQQPLKAQVTVLEPSIVSSSKNENNNTPKIKIINSNSLEGVDIVKQTDGSEIFTNISLNTPETNFKIPIKTLIPLSKKNIFPAIVIGIIAAIFVAGLIIIFCIIKPNKKSTQKKIKQKENPPPEKKREEVKLKPNTVPGPQATEKKTTIQPQPEPVKTEPEIQDIKPSNKNITTEPKAPNELKTIEPIKPETKPNPVEIPKTKSSTGPVPLPKKKTED